MSFNKLSIVALLTAQTQAAAGPVFLATADSFPFGGTGWTNGSGYDHVAQALNIPTAKFSDSIGGTDRYKGLYSALRGHLTIFFTQKMVSAGGATGGTAVASAVEAQTAGYRSFYETNVATVPTYPANWVDALDVAGESQVACKDILFANTCPNGVGRKFGTTMTISEGTGRDAVIVRRLFTSKAAQASGTTTLAYADAATFTVDKFNPDLLLHLVYQSSSQDTAVNKDGSTWCTLFHNTLSTTATSLTATQGLKDNSKCTWQIQGDVTNLPTIKLKQANNFYFIFHIVEWFDSTGLTLLPESEDTTAGSTYFVGAYPPTTSGSVGIQGTFISPLTSTSAQTLSIPQNQTPLQFQQYSPTQYLPGYLGEFAYHRQEAMFKDANNLAQNTLKVSGLQVQSVVDLVMAEYSMYTGLKTPYEDVVTTYNKAVKEETDRKADAWKNVFEPKVKIGPKPCAPTRPAAFVGPFIDLTLGNASSLVAWGHADMLAKPSAYPNTAADQTGTASYGNRDLFYYRSIALQTTGDATATVLGEVGHVFGILGQGATTMPGTVKPFYWGGTAAASTKKSGMMIGAFPEGSTTGLTGTETITFEAKTDTIDTVRFAKPSQPAAATVAKDDPNAGAGAATVAASIATLTSILVASTLY